VHLGTAQTAQIHGSGCDAIWMQVMATGHMCKGAFEVAYAAKATTNGARIAGRLVGTYEQR